MRQRRRPSWKQRPATAAVQQGSGVRKSKREGGRREGEEEMYTDTDERTRGRKKKGKEAKVAGGRGAEKRATVEQWRARRGEGSKEMRERGRRPSGSEERRGGAYHLPATGGRDAWAGWRSAPRQSSRCRTRQPEPRQPRADGKRLGASQRGRGGGRTRRGTPAPSPQRPLQRMWGTLVLGAPRGCPATGRGLMARAARGHTRLGMPHQTATTIPRQPRAAHARRKGRGGWTMGLVVAPPPSHP